jgi:hypothetical protein
VVGRPISSHATDPVIAITNNVNTIDMSFPMMIDYLSPPQARLSSPAKADHGPFNLDFTLRVQLPYPLSMGSLSEG